MKGRERMGITNRIKGYKAIQVFFHRILMYATIFMIVLNCVDSA